VTSELKKVSVSKQTGFPGRLGKNYARARFWVAQRFQRCGKAFVLNPALAAEVACQIKNKFFPQLPILQTSVSLIWP
jgi:hypothetical protein